MCTHRSDVWDRVYTVCSRGTWSCGSSATDNYDKTSASFPRKGNIEYANWRRFVFLVSVSLLPSILLSFTLCLLLALALARRQQQCNTRGWRTGWGRHRAAETEKKPRENTRCRQPVVREKADNRTVSLTFCQLKRSRAKRS